MLNLDVSAPRVVDHKYELVELLGLGSMGEVWRAQHLGLRQTCAVKLIARETHEAPEAALQRFKREARIAAALSRKTRHIVSVTDFGSDEGGAYLVMELLDGEPLDDRLVRDCTPEEVSVIVAQIAKGLGTAHREGILHRDLKPANVFLTRTEEGELLVKLLDFGIARLLVGAAPLTMKGVIVGSPAYMSPESALGEPLDVRADTWSLAVVAYEALTGVLPFAADTTESTLRRITDLESTPLREAFARTTPSLEAFFARAFAPRIEDRFQTASELATALASAVATRSAPARSAPPRGPRFSLSVAIRHDRVRFVAIAAVCAAAIGAGAMLVASSSSSSVTPVVESRAPALSYVASVRAPPVATQVEAAPAPIPVVQPKAKPVITKPKPNVDPSSIF